MKIAVPLSEKSTEALVDERFARCPFFCIYDTKSKKSELLENSLRNGSGGVGLQVSELLANLGIKKVYAVEFGPKAKDMLNKLNIETETVSKGLNLKGVIELLNKK